METVEVLETQAGSDMAMVAPAQAWGAAPAVATALEPAEALVLAGVPATLEATAARAALAIVGR